MTREKDRNLHRRQRRRNKLRKLKARLMNTKEKVERDLILDKISRLMSIPFPEELKELDKELRP